MDGKQTWYTSTLKSFMAHLSTYCVQQVALIKHKVVFDRVGRWKEYRRVVFLSCKFVFFFKFPVIWVKHDLTQLFYFMAMLTTVLRALKVFTIFVISDKLVRNFQTKSPLRSISSCSGIRIKVLSAAYQIYTFTPFYFFNSSWNLIQKVQRTLDFIWLNNYLSYYLPPRHSKACFFNPALWHIDMQLTCTLKYHYEFL